MARSERRIWPWAILAIGAVGAACMLHGFWSLMACDDDSGSPDRSYLDRCWAYDTGDGWVAGAGYFIFAPLLFVALGSLVAVIARRGAILAVVATISLLLAVGEFLTGPLLFGSPGS